MAPAFVRSADFAIDKPAGTPCPHLAADDRCGIHAELRPRGFPGCAVFDCFGAGQHVVQGTFGGGEVSRRDPEATEALFAAFDVMRRLHELLVALTAAESWPATAPVRHRIAALRTHVEALADRPLAELLAVDAAAQQAAAGKLLTEASSLVRRRHPGPDRRSADLVGADLSGADLRGALLRGAYLVGADLRRADLRTADLLGTDLRAADLRGADLRGSLFLTQPQVEAAVGDTSTRLPDTVVRPAHWAVSR